MTDHVVAPSVVATAVVAAARLLAATFNDGGRLHTHGEGLCRFDADHVAVEFLHPVITGKRALPAFVGSVPVEPRDAVLSVAYGGSKPAPDADVVLADVEAQGSTADGAIVVPLADTGVGGAKRAAVVAYHVLWETVQVLLEGAPGVSRSGTAVEALYPMLYAADREPDSGAIVESAVAKFEDSASVTAQAMADNAEAVELAVGALAESSTIFTCGNGGSATDAADVAGRFGPRGYCLTGDVATVTALSNDVGFEVAYARPLRTLSRGGDSLVALSTSGGSANVLAALRQAASLGMRTVGFAGYGGGPMAELDLDALLVVSSDSVHRIQEAQVALYTEIVRRACA